MTQATPPPLTATITHKALRLALPVPIHGYFDYLYPENTAITPKAGQRAEVPFGHRKLIGIIIDIDIDSELCSSKLKPVLKILDDTPAIPGNVIDMVTWASRYYGYPIGECVVNCLPPPLRKGKTTADIHIRQWHVSAQGKDIKPRGRKQQALLSLLKESPKGQNEPFLKSLGYTQKQLSALESSALIQCLQIPLNQCVKNASRGYSAKPNLTPEQSRAAKRIKSSLGKFDAYLLEGITGSGKTEIYLQVIEEAIQQQKQALVLIPEINLSPQTLKRFQARFPSELIMCHHSALNDSEKLTAWETIKSGQASILIGTRSAIFYPFAELACIIVDEEHDASFKQQEGFRYSARDLAVYRAHAENCPIILGSATPSLESLHNAEVGKYHKLELKARPGDAVLPTIEYVDIKSRPLKGGLSQPVLDKVATHLSSGQQVMIFLNRRGFSPSYGCHSCGWHATCPHCDIRLTYHKKAWALKCHHCDFKQHLPKQCPDCHCSELFPYGVGTERTEEFLTEHFKGTNIIRIDRDTTTRKNSMDRIYQDIQSGEPCIIVGTQMLAKGHHFPNITLVVVVSADDGLFIADFRAEETFAQLLIQVAGRAGRAQKKGEVLIQTRQAEHPLFAFIKKLDYSRLAESLLDERRQLNLPPYSHFALLRADADSEQDAIDALLQLKTSLQPNNTTTSISGPYASFLPRKANRYRFQLLIHSEQRNERQRLVTESLKFIQSMRKKASVKLQLDVDPIEIG
jgi:primosomal protein N' (replication factor Y)